MGATTRGAAVAVHASVPVFAAVVAVAVAFSWPVLLSAALAAVPPVVALGVAVRGGPHLAAHTRLAWTHAARSAVVVAVLAMVCVAAETASNRAAVVVAAAGAGAVAAYLFLAVPAVAVVFVAERRPWCYPLSRAIAPAAALATPVTSPRAALPHETGVDLSREMVLSPDPEASVVPVPSPADTAASPSPASSQRASAA